MICCESNSASCPTCDGTDTSCGTYPNCESCNSDQWVSVGGHYGCVGDDRCLYVDYEYRDYYCSGDTCTYQVTDTGSSSPYSCETCPCGCENGECQPCTTTTTSTTSTVSTTTTISCAYNCWDECVDDTAPPDCFDRISHGTTGCTGGLICCESNSASCPTTTTTSTILNKPFDWWIEWGG